MLGNSEQTAKISKTGFAKLGTTQFPSPNRLGLQLKKTGCDKFESWKKIFFVSLLGLFSPEPLFSNNLLQKPYCG